MRTVRAAPGRVGRENTMVRDGLRGRYGFERRRPVGRYGVFIVPRGPSRRRSVGHSRRYQRDVFEALER